MSAIVPDSPTGYLTIQFLDWIAEAPRTYAEVMDAWRTSCPRLSIWEDAIGERLVRPEGDGSKMRIVLTEHGRRFLQSCTISEVAGE